MLLIDEAQKRRVLKKIDDPDKAIQLFFRVFGPRFQERFPQVMNLGSTPKLFIHGNPHLDNYARTMTGAGMIDFDRSRVGPYSWDVTRFLCSLAISNEDQDSVWLSPKVLSAFTDGYTGSFRTPDIYFTMPTFLKSIEPKPEQLTMKKYLDSNSKWAKKMRKNPIDKKDEWINKALKLFLESRSETTLLNHYDVIEAGKSEGSLSKMHYLIVLAPKSTEIERDYILLDFKETYTEEDNEWFQTPTEHHGQRMIKASNLYAPGVEQRLGYFTIDGVEYWGREIPSFKAKVKNPLTESEQEELAYCVGAQLGRGHRRSYKGENPEVIEDHFFDNFDLFKRVAIYLNEEVKLGVDYLQKSERLQKSLLMK